MSSRRRGEGGAALETFSFQTREQRQRFNRGLPSRFRHAVCALDAPAHLENANEPVVRHMNNVVGQPLGVREAHVPNHVRYLLSMAR
jgi:hypothetical protein